MRRDRMPCRPAALTLAELVISLGVMGVLMLGLGSAVLVAAHALPVDQRAETGGFTAAEVADLFVEEVRTAERIVDRSATHMTFALPDRDDDGAPEPIHYQWLGSAGDPLLRQSAGGAGVALVPQAVAADFDLVLDTETESYLGVASASSEDYLSYFVSVVDDEWDRTVTRTHWAAQYFKPDLPDDAIGWTPLKVLVALRREDGVDGVGAVQLRTATADATPADLVLAQQTIDESALSYDFAWNLFSFDDVGRIPPDAGLCLVLRQTSDEGECAEWLGERDGGTGACTSGDGGATWSAYSDRCFLHSITGVYFTPGPGQTAARRFVAGARIAIQPDEDDATHVASTGRLLNRPELLSGDWVADFSQNPTLDRNGDGEPDWVRRDGAAFDPDALQDGVWLADATLDTYPPHDFDRTTVVEARFRATSVGQPGATFWINADWSNDTCAALYAQLALQDDGTQTLVLRHKLSDSESAPLLVAPNLSSDFITLRLLIAPTADTVHVQVEDDDHGSFEYETFTPANQDRFASVLPFGAAAEFDYVSVKVSE